MGLLTNPKRSIQWPKINQKDYGKSPERAINYPQLVDWTLDAEK